MSVGELLNEHVDLEVECLDRIYLNGYIRRLQYAGGLVRFLAQRGSYIPSPKVLNDIRGDFKKAVKVYAKQHGIEIISFKKGERKDDIAKARHRKFNKSHGVVFIGTAQEQMNSWKGTKKDQPGTYVGFHYSKQWVNVLHYYFYIKDEEFGPCFIKIGTYCPFPIKVCINGHEWAKQQLINRGIEFEDLDNGFKSCKDSLSLQSICDELGADQIEAFFERWLDRLPLPITEKDRRVGYGHKLSIWQMEVSLTQVFDRPLSGRQFFEDVIRDNLDLGRPDRVQLIFGKKLYKNTPSRYRTRVIQRGVQPSLHIQYKKTHVKQYFKEERALRTETTINDTQDFHVGKSLSNLDHLQRIGRNINRRLLEVERVSHNCVMSGESLDRVFQPTVSKDGNHAPGFKFGDKRSNSVFQALTLHAHLLDGITNESLRAIVVPLLGVDQEGYKATQMSYDLRKLRWKGFIWKKPKTRRYFLTPYGLKAGLFITKLNNRIFRQGFASMDASGPTQGPFGSVFRQVDKVMDSLVDWACMGSLPAT